MSFSKKADPVLPVFHSIPPAEPLPPAPAKGVYDYWWVKKANGELGVHETQGGETKRIIFFDSFTTLKATEDEVPWCSSFMCFVFDGGTHSASAKSWATWGQHLDHFVPGCIVVMERPGGHHVTIGIRLEGKTHFWGLGGNQGDKVCEGLEPMSRVIAYRWPAGEALPS